MQAALEHIRGQHGRWAILQVRANNAPAVHLYRSLGFEEVGGESRWRCDLLSGTTRPITPPSLPLRPLSYRHTTARLDLRARSLAEGGRWWWANRSPRLERASLTTWIMRALGLRTMHHWGYWMNSRLMASLDLLADRTTGRADFMVQVDTNHWGKWEQALVARAMYEATSRAMKTLVARADLEHEALLHALAGAGFREELRLLNMRKRITSTF